MTQKTGQSESLDRLDHYERSHWMADLDALAAGDLDESRRLAVLQALDNHPEGWKQCALAFLEAQAFRSCLTALCKPAPSCDGGPADWAVEAPRGAIGRATDLDSPTERLIRPSSERVPASRRPGWTRSSGWMLAACVGCAVLGGLAARVIWTGAAPGGAALAGRGTDVPASSSETQPADGGPGNAHGLLAHADPTGARGETRTSRPQTAWNAVVDFPDGRQRDVLVPVVEEGEAAPAPPAWAELERAWGDAGLVVETTRQWQPVTLPDGRSAVVPIGRLRAYPPMMPIQ